MAILWLPQARKELTEHVEFLSRESSSLALRFVESLKATCDIIEQSPMIGATIVPIRPNHADIRVWPLRRFRRYLLFYRPTADAIKIVRLLHGSQDWEGIEF